MICERMSDMSNEMVAKAEEIVRENSVNGGDFDFGMCTLSVIDEDGYPTASVVTPTKSEGLRWLMFSSTETQKHVQRLRKCSRASISFSSETYCINLVGDVEIIDSEEVKQELWYEGMEFKLTGPDDPNYCVLKFTTKRYKLFIDFEEVEGTF